MNIPVGLLALITLIIVAAYIARPFFAGTSSLQTQSDAPHRAVQHRRANLLAERNRIYAAIRQLDFEHETNKVSAEDYADQRYRLVAQGVDVLQQLDSLPPPSDDTLEARIEALLKAVQGQTASAPSANAPSPAPGETEQTVCPNCGSNINEHDRFCGNCGHRLRGTPPTKAAEPAPRHEKG